jgi:hypothetical protein
VVKGREGVMKWILVPLTVVTVLVTAPAAGSGSRAVSYWSEFDASQRLSIGRFAAANGIDHAICLGIGTMKVTKYGEKKFRAFDCRAGDDSFERERQLTLRVLSPTRFAVTWLREQTCAPKP